VRASKLGTGANNSQIIKLQDAIMNIFLSWSGSKSQKAALLFNDWLPSVIQKATPWISTEIDRGATWFTEIQSSLSKCNQGVIFVTRENQVKPWLQFEAGAISKGIGSNRVYTYLVDLSISDIESGSPLVQINHTTATKEQTLKLIQTINRQMDEEALNEQVLNRTFERMWPDLEQGLAALREDTKEISDPVRPPAEVLNDILENVLSINQRISIEPRDRSQQFLPSRSVKIVVENLLQYGLHPDAIVEILRGVAPLGFLKREIGRNIMFTKPGEPFENYLNTSGNEVEPQ
jgi:hypothetical protein